MSLSDAGLIGRADDMGLPYGRSKAAIEGFRRRTAHAAPGGDARLYSRPPIVYASSAMGPGSSLLSLAPGFCLFEDRGERATMANVVVVGAQWGDEGKGKIVDWLSFVADVVVRFQGGHNAGHTLVIDGKVFKLALLPSGIVRPGKLSVIGNGVVLDPYHLVEEIEKLSSQGVEVTPANLKIAENVPLILSLHRELDAHRESASVRGTRSAPPSAGSARPTRTRSAGGRSG